MAQKVTVALDDDLDGGPAERQCGSVSQALLERLLAVEVGAVD